MELPNLLRKNPELNYNVMRKYTAIIEGGPITGYSIYIADNEYPHGIIGLGKTVKEAKEDFYFGYEEMRECVESMGKRFQEGEFVFKYDIPSFLNEFSHAFTLAGLERITGVNQKQLGHYISGYRKPSEKTIRKIESGIHAFSEQLSAVQFI